MGGRKPTKYKASDVIIAIKGSYGLKTVVCNRLRVSRPTLDSYCRRWSSVGAALRAETELVLDLAESTIIKAIIRGCIKTSKWFLTLKGSGRGYVRPAPVLPRLPDDEVITEVGWAESFPGPDQNKPVDIKALGLPPGVSARDLGVDDD